eukprot:216645-Hanusia_phi.AAC.1
MLTGRRDFSGRHAQQAASFESMAGSRNFLFDSQITTDSLESSLSQASTAGPEGQACASIDHPAWADSDIDFVQVSQCRASQLCNGRLSNAGTSHNLRQPGITCLYPCIQTTNKRKPSPVGQASDDLDIHEGNIKATTSSLREQTIRIYDDLFKEILETLRSIKSCLPLKDEIRDGEKDEKTNELRSIEQEFATVFDFLKQLSEENKSQIEEMMTKINNLEKSSDKLLETLRTQICERKQMRNLDDSFNEFVVQDIFLDPFEERAKHKADQRIAKIHNRIKSRRVKKGAR